VGDSEALAAAMRRLMELPPEARRRMAEAARAGAARFDIRQVVSRWEDLYRELQENAPGWM
jgi:glycosyltransferase involved in cell wall biosynthesis